MHHKEKYRVCFNFKSRPLIMAVVISVFILFLSLLILLCIAWFGNMLPNNMEPVKIEYYEDAAGELTFSQIETNISDSQFTALTGNAFLKGYTSSTWWLKFSLKDTVFENTGVYITIDNVYNKCCNLYIPVECNGIVQYTELRSGYTYGGDGDGERFLYPSFKLPDNVTEDEYVYLKLMSPTQQNANINIYTEKQYDNFANRTMMICGLIFGCMIAIGVYCFLAFCISLRDVSYLYFVLLIIFGVLVDLMETGVFRMFFNNMSDKGAKLPQIISLFCYIPSLMMFKKYFNTKKSFKKTDRFIVLLILFLSLGIILAVLNCLNILILHELLSVYLIAAGLLYFSFQYAFLAYALTAGGKVSRYMFVGAGVALIPSLYSLLKYSGILLLPSSVSYLPLISLAISDLLFALALAERYKTQEAENIKAQKQLKSAKELAKIKELEFLRAQIKPHFLHNTINVIAALCKLDPQKARRLISDMSSYLRHSFDFSNSTELVTLAEELDYVQAYANIQMERFVDEFTVEYEIDDVGDFKLPPFILQPLVENAIRHGLRKHRVNGKVLIRVKNREDGYFFSVSDNGSGMKKEEVDYLFNSEWDKGHGIGVTNINYRLKELYGTCLEYESSPGKGTTVSFWIPKVGNERTETVKMTVSRCSEDKGNI